MRKAIGWQASLQKRKDYQRYFNCSKRVCWNNISQSRGKIDECVQYNKVCLIWTETIYTIQHLFDISEESHITQFWLVYPLPN